MKHLLLGAILSLLFVSSIAGAKWKGTVQQLEFGPYIGSKVLVVIAKTEESSSKAECATNSVHHFAFDGETETGKMLFAGLLAAQKSKSVIQIAGQGTCNTMSGIEDIRWVHSW